VRGTPQRGFLQNRLNGLTGAQELTVSFAAPGPSQSRSSESGVGIRNYLIEGVSCAGKTTVCEELERRGYQAIHGDRQLAYRGDPRTGEPVDGHAPGHHIWDVERVRDLVAGNAHAMTFFCGGCRNSDQFIDLFDGVFVLEIDLDTLNERLAARPEDEWGGTASEGEAFARLQHATKEGLPTNAVMIDATKPLSRVVDTILDLCQRSTGGRVRIRRGDDGVDGPS